MVIWWWFEDDMMRIGWWYDDYMMIIWWWYNGDIMMIWCWYVNDGMIMWWSSNSCSQVSWDDGEAKEFSAIFLPLAPRCNPRCLYYSVYFSLYSSLYSWLYSWLYYLLYLYQSSNSSPVSPTKGGGWGDRARDGVKVADHIYADMSLVFGKSFCLGKISRSLCWWHVFGLLVCWREIQNHK